jgi:mitogen-activated protein kinase 1/3
MDSDDTESNNKNRPHSGDQSKKKVVKIDYPVKWLKNKHSFTIAGSEFIIDERYEYVKQIGVGAYGVVISCYDKKTNHNVAIKKVGNAFEDLIDAKRIVREIKLLRYFKHDNIVSLIDIQKPPGRTGFEDIYIITDLMETDLHRVIYSRQELTDDHIQYFIYQILRGVLYMHSANIIHRDLKPANILANKNCDLKICDFGLDHGKLKDDDKTVQNLIDNPSQPIEYSNSIIYDDTKRELNDRNISRWYRAPEAILSPESYDKPVDIWSIGCILAELLGRQPLFPADNNLDELQKIISVLGSPSEADLDFITDEKIKNFVLRLAKRTKQSFNLMFSNANPVALDLLGKMLTFNPKKRYTVEQCISHPYFEGLHDPEQEPTAESTFDFSFDKESLSKEKLRSMIYEQSLHFHEEDE